MDGVRLTDAQKHRLASQNEDCHSKNRFWELPQVMRQVQKQIVLRGHRNSCFL
jgi:hypothetical protein